MHSLLLLDLCMSAYCVQREVIQVCTKGSNSMVLSKIRSDKNRTIADCEEYIGVFVSKYNDT